MRTQTTQLTNQEIARIFAMYLYTETWHYSDWKEDSTGVLSGQLLNLVKDTGTKHGLLYLTPLEKISDEDAIEVASFYGFKLTGDVTPENLASFGRNQVQLDIEKSWLWQFLIQKGYAVPIYPYGKTAIELGIAIDKTTIE